MTQATTPPRYHVLTLTGEDYVTIKCPFDNESEFTISLWARPTGPKDEEKRGLIGNPRELRDPCLALTPSTGGLYFEAWKASDTGAGQISELPNFFSQHQWCHVTWVKRGGQQEFYRNGLHFETRVIMKGVYSSGKEYGIGRVETNWIGEIADVRIFNIARPPEDIERDFARRLTGTEPGLVGYWPCDEAGGTVLKDQSSSGNHGKIHGVPRWSLSPLPLVGESPVTGKAPRPEPGGHAYWLRWRQDQRKKHNDGGNDESFRRGVIWR